MSLPAHFGSRFDESVLDRSGQVAIMKKTRKQKIRQKKERRRHAEDRRFAIAERMLDLLNVRQVLTPYLSKWKPELVERISPRVKVTVAEGSKEDALVDDIRRDCERVIDTPVPLVSNGHEVEASIDDLLRGYFAMLDFIRLLHMAAHDPSFSVGRLMKARLDEAKARAEDFEQEFGLEVTGRLLSQINFLTDQFLRFDQQIIWYRVELTEGHSNGGSYRIVLGRRKQIPVSLPVRSERRKAYPCEQADPVGGLTRQTWNPARLGIGALDAEIPVYIGDHAISRLHERIPVAPFLSMLHKMLRTSMEEPRIHPSGTEGEFLVEAGEPDRKLGYFVVALCHDFVFVKTFLFLTMQGTPEARLLRENLGLSRGAIEYHKLDNFFTLSQSDLGEDPELRSALDQCGCGHLLGMVGSENRLSWLENHCAPLRRAIGLPSRPAPCGGESSGQTGKHDVETMTAVAQRYLKRIEGWIT
jgi:hypothetical protein